MIQFFYICAYKTVKRMKTIVITDISEIESIIHSCNVCYVGMADEKGMPYVLPMNFGYKDHTIYLHSGPTGRSISTLELNPMVCITFCSGRELVAQDQDVACSYRMRSKSVIAWGKVRFVEDQDRKVDALNIIMKQYTDRPFKYADPAVVNVKIWEVPVDEISCKGFGIPYSNR